MFEDLRKARDVAREQAPRELPEDQKKLWVLGFVYGTYLPHCVGHGEFSKGFSRGKIWAAKNLK